MATTQTSKITMRHGAELELPGAPISLNPLAFEPGLDIAEIGYCTDTGRLLIGHAPGVGQANYKRPTFPYQNIEILTEASVDTIRRFFNFNARDIGADGHYSAALTPGSDWQDVAVDRSIGAATPYVFHGSDVLAKIEYFVMTDFLDGQQRVRTPLRQGTLRIISTPNDDAAEVSDDGASVRRLDIATPLVLDGTFTMGSIAFRAIRGGTSGDPQFRLQCLYDLPHAGRVYFSVVRPR